MNINWWALMIISYWLSAGLACIGVKSADPITIAFLSTILTGVFYIFHKLWS